MPDRLTQKELDDFRAKEKAATQDLKKWFGGWTERPYLADGCRSSVFAIGPLHGVPGTVLDDMSAEDWEWRDKAMSQAVADAAFLVASRSYVSRLLDDVEYYKEALKAEQAKRGV